MNKDLFIKEINKLGIDITNLQLQQLEDYYTLLVSYNEKVNLTAITNKDDVYLKHFYDSLTLIKAVNLKNELSLCDIGTGAGFPGLVLKIVFPSLSVTLIDSLDKRIKFLNEVIKKLNLKNIIAIHNRIEELKVKESYDIIVSRAVAKTNILLELGCQLPKVNGLFILMKGNIFEEINNSLVAIKTLNYSLENIINFKLPIENSERNILVLKKQFSTNNKYPRKFSEIKKKSL